MGLEDSVASSPKCILQPSSSASSDSPTCSSFKCTQDLLLCFHMFQIFSLFLLYCILNLKLVGPHRSLIHTRITYVYMTICSVKYIEKEQDDSQYGRFFHTENYSSKFKFKLTLLDQITKSSNIRQKIACTQRWKSKWQTHHSKFGKQIYHDHSI